MSGSMTLSRRSWPGIARMRSANAWRRSPALASSRPARLRPPSLIRTLSARAATWPPGSGLVPRQSGTGGKVRLGHISKQGDRYLRRLLVLGATTLLRHARGKASAAAGWINALLARRPAGIVKIAIANKLARVAWAVLQGNQGYRARSSSRPHKPPREPDGGFARLVEVVMV